MTAITTAAAGNWSATGTWTGGVVPGNGDTVTLNHNVTVDVNTIIGTSPAENSGTYAITWGAATKLLTLASGVTLTVRGDCLAKGNTTKNNVVYMNAGSVWEFDASQASTPASQNYRFIFGTASNQYTVFRAMGSSGSRCTIRSNASGGNAFFTRNSLAACGWLHAEYTDFVRIGDATNPLLNYYLGNTSNAEMTLTNCTLDSCGVVTSSSGPATNATISITNTSFKSSAGTNPLALPGFTNTGTKTITGNVFDKVVVFGQGAWTVEDNLFMEAYTSTAGTKWASSARNFVRKTTQPTVNVYGDCTDEFWYKDGAITNPHHLTCGVTTGLTISGCIFAHANANGTGDATQPGAPTGARTHTIRNCILLADDDSEVQPGKLQGAGGNANVTIVNEHNTYISTNAGETGSGYGETYAGYDGIVSIKSCLAWSPNSGEASIGIRQAGSVQQSDATKWDYNAVWNARTGTDGAGYNSISAGTIFSAGSPGAHDVSLAGDPFFDRTRNLPTWDAALGGPGTAANALAELAKRNDASGYNSAYSITALVAWIKQGFQVIDPSLQNAGHDGATIGASPYLATLATSLTGAVTAASDLTSAAASGAVLEAALAAALTETAALDVAKPLAVALAGAATSSAALDLPKPLAASLAAAVTASFGLTVPKPLAASLAAAVTHSVDLSAAGSGAALQAALSASVTATSALTITKALATTLAAGVTSTAALTVPKPLAATLAAAMTVAATLDVSGPGAALAASLGLSATATGDLVVSKPLLASLGVSVASSSALLVPKPLAVAIGISFGLSGDIVGTLLMRLTAGVAITPRFGALVDLETALAATPRLRGRFAAAPSLTPES